MTAIIGIYSEQINLIPNELIYSFLGFSISLLLIILSIGFGYIGISARIRGRVLKWRDDKDYSYLYYQYEDPLWVKVDYTTTIIGIASGFLSGASLLVSLVLPILYMFELQ